MMTDNTTTTKNHSLYYFNRYLDIADMSHRFAAPKLETWALKQLKDLSNSLIQLSVYPSTVSYQLRALDYTRVIQDKSLEHRVRTVVKLSYSYLLSTTLATLNESAILPRKIKLLELFKHPNLQKDQPSLFGFVFCVVLSLGHKFWLHQPSLTRDDRIMLLSANTLLTPLPFLELELDWIEGSLTEAKPRGCEPGPRSCTRCNFQPAWARAFLGDYPKELRERQEPSGGVASLSALITKRTLFGDALVGLGKGCTKNCKERFVEFVDERVERVFTLFAGFFKDIE